MATSMKGIQIQQSRFAVLMQDSSSDEDEGWHRHTGSKGSKNKGEEKKDGQTTLTSKAAAKNAKRRAKKKKVLQADSDGKPSNDEDAKYYQLWQKTEEIAVESEYQKDLNEAMLQSLADDENDKKQRLEAPTKSQPQKPKTKKGVMTVTLQEFHRLDTTSVPLETDQTPTSHEENGKGFFDMIESEVQAELKKEMKKQKKKATSGLSSTQKDQPQVSESVRIAQLKDELEKKDQVIKELKADQENMKAKVKEVGTRNQVLYKMLSKGELATKAELLEQVEELSSVKDEMTKEIERLHCELEQERSKTKVLKADILKLQGAKGSNSKS